MAVVTRVGRFGRLLMGATGVALLSGVAFAGGGDVLPFFDPAGNMQGIRVTGKMYVDSPRTPAELDDMKRQLRGMARTLCDATEGVVSFEEIEFVNHPSEKANADFVWYRRNNPDALGRTAPRAHVEASGPALGQYGQRVSRTCTEAGELRALGPGPGQIYLYGTPETNPGNYASLTIAHELGHLLLGLGDQYHDIRANDMTHVRSSSITGRESDLINGLRAYRNPREGYPFQELAPRPGLAALKLDGTDLYVGGPRPGGGNYEWWLQNNTIMQGGPGIDQFCRRAVDALTPSVLNPLWTDTGCSTDADCSAYYTGFDHRW